MRARTTCLETGSMRGVIAFGVSCCLLLLVLPADARADESASEAPTTPPRPPPLPPLTPSARSVTRHVDMGAAVALVNRVAEGQTDGSASLMRYPSAVGLGLSARVDIL